MTITSQIYSNSKINTLTKNRKKKIKKVHKWEEVNQIKEKKQSKKETMIQYNETYHKALNGEQFSLDS